ncbi:unnamed protein product [Alternaria alternata]
MHESRSLEEIKPEEIAELLEERAKRNKAKHDIYRATHKKEIRATQKIWDEENKEHRKEGKRQWNEENKEHINEYARKRAKTAKETAQFPCNDCGLNFANKKELKRHKDSEIAYVLPNMWEGHQEQIQSGKTYGHSQVSLKGHFNAYVQSSGTTRPAWTE